MAAFSVNTTNAPYGPIQQGFTFALQDGYSVLTGRNNAGKSALLQLLAVRAYHDQSIGADGFVYIPPHRGFVAPSTETRGANLRTYNAELIQNITSQPLQHDAPQRPLIADLPVLLINHTNFRRQTVDLDRYLVSLGFSELVLRDAQQTYFDDVAVVMHGSGLRSLFTIICALTDERLKMILIDEPENSLEPRLQKALRDILVDRARSVNIAVATHSHLFLNRVAGHERLNYIVERENGLTNPKAIETRDGLLSITFELLGSNTEDLFFPGNYLVVEGASDQKIAEAVLRLRAVALTKVKVLSATGVTNVKNRIAAIENSLVPLIVDDSPYASKVVALIDEPRASEKAQVTKLGEYLGERLHILSAPSLEEYLPDELYVRANRDKGRDLVELSGHQAQGRLQDLRRLKSEIATEIAGLLVADDLGVIPEIVSAVDRAVRLAQ